MQRDILPSKYAVPCGLTRLVLLAFALCAAPSSWAQWSGGSGSSDCYEPDSKVGIGTSTPSAMLHVKQLINDPNTVQTARFVPYTAGQRMSLIHYGPNADWYIRSGSTSGNVLLQDTGGSVGIGTASPSERLDIAGGDLGLKSGNNITFGTSGVAAASATSAGWKLKLWDNGAGAYSYGLGVASNELWMTSAGSFTLMPGGGYGAADRNLKLDTTGKLGIGMMSTQTPLAMLHVRNTLADPAQPTAWFNPLNNGRSSYIHIGTNGDWYIRSASTAGKVLIQDDGGNVGIGLTNPQYKLTVNGEIGARDVTVSNAPWSDFVFADGYQLMPLEQVAEFVEQNNHLPGVPTELEVREKGASVGQTQAKLLEKVEELTLYAIELDRKNARLAAENEALRQEIASRTASLEERLARLEQR